eukprot:TRINITY_DN11452_c0_g4_i1.p2 TRINITY_DN11452_c0_g4~~TRINITY_DN11452_c0_g4_i1.p2  ORF type:complete len:507 (+),score=165.09 TRINITY_DN11452_c0_g4_i1:143-1663(+)
MPCCRPCMRAVAALLRLASSLSSAGVLFGRGLEMRRAALSAAGYLAIAFALLSHGVLSLLSVVIAVSEIAAPECLLRQCALLHAWPGRGFAMLFAGLTYLGGSAARAPSGILRDACEYSALALAGCGFMYALLGVLQLRGLSDRDEEAAQARKALEQRIRRGSAPAPPDSPAASRCGTPLRLGVPRSPHPGRASGLSPEDKERALAAFARLGLGKEGGTAGEELLRKFAAEDPEAMKLKMGVCLQDVRPAEVDAALARLALARFDHSGEGRLDWKDWKNFWYNAIVDSAGKQDFVWRLIFLLLDPKGQGFLGDSEVERLLDMFYAEGSIFKKADGSRDPRLPERPALREHIYESLDADGDRRLTYDEIYTVFSGNCGGEVKRKGYLHKFALGREGGSGRRNWKRRWFVADQRSLLYWATREEHEGGEAPPKGGIPWGPGVRLLSDADKGDHPSAGGHPSRCMMLDFDDSGKRLQLLLRADSTPDRNQWTDFIAKQLRAAGGRVGPS